MSRVCADGRVVRPVRGDGELRAEVERLLAGEAPAKRDRSLPTTIATEIDEPGKNNAPGEKSEIDWAPSAHETSVDAAVPASTRPSPLTEHPDYLIMRELGRGGMGVVYLAQNRLLGRHEVLKVISREIMDRPGALDRFLREIRAVAELRHPNIVTAYHAARLGDSIVFAMEHVEGLDLSRLVKARGPLPVSHACSYIHQAALGLEHAHERGMVHRDIKPSNLMLAREGNRAIIKVLDFGLAKVKSEQLNDSGLTREGQLLGTPDYVAPSRHSTLATPIFAPTSTALAVRCTTSWPVAHHSTPPAFMNYCRPITTRSRYR